MRLNADHRRIAAGAARVALFLLLGKFAGAAKEMAVAYRYGVSDIVDAYQFTLTLASWLPVTLVGVLSVVLIPVLVRLRRQGPPEERTLFLRELQGWAWLVGVVLAGMLYLAWPWVLPIMGQGLSETARQASGELMFAFAPTALFTILAGISAARLLAHEKHLNTLLESIPAFCILAAVLLAGPGVAVGPLLWGTLAGYLVQSAWLMRLSAQADGMSGLPQPGFRATPWRDLIPAAGIMLVGQVAMSFVGPIDQFMAAQLGQNANATLGYATRLLALILGLGALSVGRAALPVLSDIQARGQTERARKTAIQWSLAMLGLGTLAVVIGWLLAPWGVALVFERGAFTAHDTRTVAHVVRWGLLQLPFYFGVLVLVQLLASQQRYRIMAAIALANFALKALTTALLAPVMGLPGIMLATGLMYALSYGCYVLAALHKTRPVSR